MMRPDAGSEIRACADAVVRTLERHGHDTAALSEALREPFARLLRRSDLLTIGVQRTGNHVSNSQYLYYDGDLSILIFQLPEGKRIPAHDHGNWESIFVYRGRVQHTVYERLDDGTVPGFADLKVVDDRVLEPGASAVIAPPADIHTFMGLSEETYAITVASGTYKAERCYFQPDDKTYFVKDPRA